MISSLLAFIALLVAWSSKNSSSGLKDRLVRLEEALEELTTQMRWLRAERRGEAPEDDGPLFAPDAGMARPDFIEQALQRAERVAPALQVGIGRGDRHQPAQREPRFGSDRISLCE